MAFSYNATGIEVSDGGKWEPMPEGDYTLKIVDAKLKQTKNGDPMIEVDASVVEPVAYKGKEVRHWVTFFKDKTNKGAGIALQFLKNLGLPWEGQIQVDHQAWIGRRFRAHIGIEAYVSTKDGKEYENNKIKYLLDRDHAAEQDATRIEKEEEIPF